jgi:3-hydroxyacyl-[acyl-carrier-protein] dehydratase
MPGVLILEALAQLGAAVVLGEEKNQGKLALFTGIDGARFEGRLSQVTGWTWRSKFYG